HRPRRRRRTERAARAGRHRRPAGRDRHDAVHRADHLFVLAHESSGQSRAAPAGRGGGGGAAMVDHMREDNTSATEAQLRREVEELKRQLAAHRHHAAGAPANRWRPSRITIAALLAGVVVLLALAFAARHLPLQRREAILRAEADAQQKQLPRLGVIRVAPAAGENAITLPGTMQAVTEAPILARTDGYLKRRLVDIGDRVRAGQVVAEIDAPELDQQIHHAEAAVQQAEAAIEQAQASLEQGKANRDLARMTAERSKMLTEKGITSQHEGDQSQAQFAAQDASVQALEKSVVAQRSNLAAARADLARLQAIQAYRLVKAPFDGVITVRNVDVGALV